MKYDNINIQATLKETTDEILKVIIQKEKIYDVDSFRKSLEEIIDYHKWRYYDINSPLISDQNFDLLFQKLQEFENSLWREEAQTHLTVGYNSQASISKASHLTPMLSLNNSYNVDDLIEWDKKNREVTSTNEIQYCVEPKYDGASISLIYENDMLIKAITRGDGNEGEIITKNALKIDGVIKKISMLSLGIKLLEIRGEVLITKKDFTDYNLKLIEKGKAIFANPRNAASGALRLKDSMEVNSRQLKGYFYHISYYELIGSKEETELIKNTYFKSQMSCINLIEKLGLRTPQKGTEIFELQGIQKVNNYCKNFEEKRELFDYEIDGAVVKVNDFKLQEKLGMTSHHPRWAIAFKFKARQATTKLLAVEYQVGRTGAVTPVAKLAPVYLGGVTVSSISIHNEEYIKEKDLKIGDAVLIERAGDVIPQIVQSLPAQRTGNEQTIVFPKTCPVCTSELFKEEGEAVWRCINIECEAQVVEKIIHFVSKDAMDIKSFGDANVRKFYELGLLKDIPGVYTLDYSKISGLEGFGKKSIDNLQLAIEASKQQPLHRLLYGLGIRFVGETTAKTLANAVEHLLDYTNKTEDDLQQLEDVGVKVAKSIRHFFSNEQNIAMLQHLETLGLQLKNTKKEIVASGGLAGQTFLFTGTLAKYKRSEVEAMAEAQGGIIVSGVSAKLNYLVVGTDAGSKLEKAKKINTIKIISEDEFLQLIEA